MYNWKDCTRLGGVDILETMPSTIIIIIFSADIYLTGEMKTYVAVGPVSASPSPTTQATMRSGLSITAPKDTLRAYPNSPPSWIQPGVSAFMWLQISCVILNSKRLRNSISLPREASRSTELGDELVQPRKISGVRREEWRQGVFNPEARQQSGGTMA